jgi:uncharacterized protein
MSKSTALVTGASSGIGLELARSLAASGHDLILVARSEAELNRIAAELRAAHAVKVQVEIADLAQPGAGRSLAQRIEASGTAVDLLINNAGFGLSGALAENDPERVSGMIAVNIAALTDLTRAFLPAMLARRRGGVLNVASTAAFQPGPLMAVYYASKAYVLSFSEALWEECRGTGVQVSCLCPGPTVTNFGVRADMTKTLLFSGGLMPKMDAAGVARAGLDGLKNNQRVVVPGIVNALIAASAPLTPKALGLRLVRRLQSVG